MNGHIAVSLMLAAGGLCSASRLGGQGKTLDPAGLEVFNRTATSLTDGARTGVRLSARADNGVAYLKGVELGNGSISGGRTCRGRASWAWRFTEWTTRRTTPCTSVRSI